MILPRATAINLAGRKIGTLYNDPKPVIRFTMTEGTHRREVTKLLASEGICPTCMEDYLVPVRGPRWSDADHIHIMHVINGRITGRRNRGEKRKAA